MRVDLHPRTMKEEKGPTYAFLDFELAPDSEQEREWLVWVKAIGEKHGPTLVLDKKGNLTVRFWQVIT